MVARRGSTHGRIRVSTASGPTSIVGPNGKSRGKPVIIPDRRSAEFPRRKRPARLSACCLGSVERKRLQDWPRRASAWQWRASVTFGRRRSWLAMMLVGARSPACATPHRALRTSRKRRALLRSPSSAIAQAAPRAGADPAQRRSRDLHGNGSPLRLRYKGFEGECQRRRFRESCAAHRGARFFRP